MDLHHRFVRIRRGQADNGESCIVLQSGPTHSLVAISFRSVQSLLAVREFCAAGEEGCKQDHGWVCVNL